MVSLTGSSPRDLSPARDEAGRNSEKNASGGEKRRREKRKGREGDEWMSIVGKSGGTGWLPWNKGQNGNGMKSEVEKAKEVQVRDMRQIEGWVIL